VATHRLKARLEKLRQVALAAINGVDTALTSWLATPVKQQVRRDVSCLHLPHETLAEVAEVIAMPTTQIFALQTAAVEALVGFDTDAARLWTWEPGFDAGQAVHKLVQDQRAVLQAVKKVATKASALKSLSFV